ncbi:MAG: ABC transporter substrate-binding protein, partial [Clostridium sp.]
MNKKVKSILAAFVVGAFTLGVVGCSNTGNSKEATGNENKDFEEVTYTYSNGGKNYNVVVDKQIEKAVTLSQFMTEMLLALGLENRMVGTALLDNEILPEFKDAYEKIPKLLAYEGHNVAKESFVASGADFVSGWDSSINDVSTGSPEELIENGVKPFLAKSYEGDATIETVYEDFETLGKIFGVENKATEVIEKMKSDINIVKDKIKDIKAEDRVKVMVYDSGENDAYVVGS